MIKEQETKKQKQQIETKKRKKTKKNDLSLTVSNLLIVFFCPREITRKNCFFLDLE